MRGTPPKSLERTPGEFLALLGLPDPPTPETFIAEATREMARALALPPNERDGAYALLAADAHLTWACEAALAEGVSETAFRDVLEAFLDLMSERSP